MTGVNTEVDRKWGGEKNDVGPEQRRSGLDADVKAPCDR